MFSYHIRQGFRKCLKYMILVLTSPNLTTEIHLLFLMLLYLAGELFQVAKSSESCEMLYSGIRYEELLIVV